MYFVFQPIYLVDLMSSVTQDAMIITLREWVGKHSSIAHKCLNYIASGASKQDTAVTAAATAAGAKGNLASVYKKTLITKNNSFNKSSSSAPDSWTDPNGISYIKSHFV